MMLKVSHPTNREFGVINEYVVHFYREALTKDPLTAAAETLSLTVPGALQLAFLTGRRDEVLFGSNHGAAGRDFLMATLGTAASHPLIYRTEGAVRAIGDVLKPKEWQRRAMYQAARPLLDMRDALGTDFYVNSRWKFSACVVRDRSGFTQTERRAFRYLIPHFRNVFALVAKRPGTLDAREALHVIPLPEAASRRSRADFAAERIHALFPELAPSENTLAIQASAWVKSHQGRVPSAAGQLVPVLYRAAHGVVVCLPASAWEPTTLVVQVPRRDRADSLIAQLTSRESATWCIGSAKEKPTKRSR